MLQMGFAYFYVLFEGTRYESVARRAAVGQTCGTGSLGTVTHAWGLEG